IRGYPNDAIAALGLFLIAEQHQRRGVGREAYALVEQFIRTWGNCARIRIGVVRTNDEVLPFWLGLGFVPTGEKKPYRYGPVQSETIVLEKTLATDASAAISGRSRKTAG